MLLGLSPLAAKRAPSGFVESILAGNVHPDPTFADAASWDYTGGASCDGTALVYSASGSATLNDSSGKLTALNAALTDSTNYTVSIQVTGWVSGTVTLRLKTGGSSNMSVTGDGTFARTVASGVSTSHPINATGPMRIESISVVPL